MYKCEMDPTRTVGATERTRDAGRMDGRTDGRTDGVKPIYPPTTFFWGGHKKTDDVYHSGQNAEKWQSYKGNIRDEPACFHWHYSLLGRFTVKLNELQNWDVDSECKATESLKMICAGEQGVQ